MPAGAERATLERMDFPDVTLAILAGGKASRLGGAPKGLLRLDGRTLVERHLAFGARFADVLLVANDLAPYRSYGVRATGDLVPDRGAPGGVHAALASSHTPWILALAVDMPFVRAEAVRLLLDARGSSRLVCFERDGHLEPLLGAYAASLAAEWEPLLAQAPPFRKIFSALGGRALPEGALRAVDPTLESLVNVNSPEDVARFGLEWPPGWPPAGMPCAGS